MVKRRFWLQRIEQAWGKRPVVWLMGVRRAGKTFLCRSVPGHLYFDCELPSVRRMLEQPESFLEEHGGKIVVLDEIHRLGNPSELLKIAADHYPNTRILATGSSTLGASARFRDTLAGRKTEILLTPMNAADLEDFGGDLQHRLAHGGLPPFFASKRVPETDSQEWLDAYWAKDILELFRLDRRYSFLKFAELLFAQSGGIFEASRLARPCEISRTTATNYLSVLEATFVVTVIRPFNSGRASEIVAAPKVYGFDTGFVCFCRGWHSLRPDDLGPLWEHYVLNELRSGLPGRRIQYWRDKQRHEIDFVLPGAGGAAPVAVECKWTADAFDPANLLVFRRQYGEGQNFVVAQDVSRSFTKTFHGVVVRFLGLNAVIKALAGQTPPMPAAGAKREASSR